MKLLKLLKSKSQTPKESYANSAKRRIKEEYIDKTKNSIEMIEDSISDLESRLGSATKRDDVYVIMDKLFKYNLELKVLKKQLSLHEQTFENYFE